METGGQAAIRGFLVQTLIALLEGLEDGKNWQSVALEPNIESDKVDILWKYPDRSKAVQVKSSRNPFKRADVERWAAELESWREAEEYELVLVGTPGADSVAKMRRSGRVSILPAKNLDIQAFKEQAAFRLEQFMSKYDLAPCEASRRMMLVEALEGHLATLASTGKERTRSELVELLTGWVSPTAGTNDACADSCTGSSVRLIKVFVSGPDDVFEERARVGDICASINRTEGPSRGVRLEPFRWDRDGIPQIGPGPIRVMEMQTPAYHIFLGIISSRFGEPSGKHRSGTEKEFDEALKKWKKAGKPWIMYYFNDQPPVPKKSAEAAEYVKVCEFREKLEAIGLVGTYKGLHGSPDGFYEKVSEHLRMVVNRLPLLERRPDDKPTKNRQKGAAGRGSSRKEPSKPVFPPEYRDWLFGECGEMELMGLQPKEGMGVLLHHVYTPLITSGQTGGGEKEPFATKLDRESLLLRKEEQRHQLLLDLLAEKSLYVSGDPGSGKSVFCRWVAWLLCKEFMPPESEDTAAPEGYRDKFPEKLRGKLPVLVRLRDFWTHLQPLERRPVGLSYLETAFESWFSALEPRGLNWGCLRAHLNYGSTMLLLDGVDEVPPAHVTDGKEWSPREMLLDALTKALKRWTEAGNRVLLTSRPYGLEGSGPKKLGLESAPIQGMDQELQYLLTRRWFVQLRVDRGTGLGEAAAMMEHIRGVRGLDMLAANPLLLTAMCIVYNEGKRLPEDKYELYDRIVDTVLHKRYPPDKVRISAIRERLGAIALGMHTGEAAGLKRESGGFRTLGRVGSAALRIPPIGRCHGQGTLGRREREREAFVSVGSAGAER